MNDQKSFINNIIVIIAVIAVAGTGYFVVVQEISDKGQALENLPAGEYPAWVNRLIMEVESYPVSSPPVSLTQFQYRNQTVYYLPVYHCCDFMSSVYNESGDYICAPSGGFTAIGDGNCPDFFTARKNPRVIWTDTRQ